MCRILNANPPSECGRPRLTSSIPMALLTQAQTDAGSDGTDEDEVAYIHSRTIHSYKIYLYDVIFDCKYRRFLEKSFVAGMC